MSDATSSAPRGLMREVFRFEFRLQARRVSTWVFATVLLLAGVIFVIALTRDIGYNANAPTAIVQYSIVIGFGGVLVSAALFGDAGSRDAITRLQPLLYTTPLEKYEYLLGRYAAAFAVNALVLLAIPLGQMLAVVLPGLEPELIGPFRLMSYVRAYVLFLLPALLINSAFLYAIALTSRRVLPVYLGTIGLFALYGIGSVVASEALSRSTGALVDPTGIIAVIRSVIGWSVGQLNTQEFPVSSHLLLNRAIWVGISLLVLAFAFTRFRFAHVAERAGRRRTVEVVQREDEARVARLAPATPAAAPQSFGGRDALIQVVSVARRSFLEIVRSREFQVLMVGLAAFAVAISMDGGIDQFGTPSWPVTGALAKTLTSIAFALIIGLIGIFYAGELTWRERDLRVHDIVDASPVADWVPFAGKTIGLCLVLALLQAVLLVTGLLLQLTSGYYTLEPGLWFQILFGLQFVDYVLYAVMAMFVHAIVDQKYAAHGLAALLLIIAIYAPLFGVVNLLLLYASDPGWAYSDLSRFGPSLPAFAWFKAYWLAWSFVLAILATSFWVRGRESTLRGRVAAARRRFTPRVALLSGVAAALVLVTSGVIVYNTRILNEHRTAEGVRANRAEYERRYKALSTVAQPKISAVSLRAELYPERRMVDVAGTYVLVNRTSTPIDSVVVYLAPMFEPRSMSFDRPSRRVLADSVHRIWVHALESPLAPGDSMRMDWDLGFAPRGFRATGVNSSIVGNGIYIEREQMPGIGYQRSAEVEDAGDRRTAGLPPRVGLPAATDSAARAHIGSSNDAGLIRFEAIIGTSEDQVASTSGSLLRTWMEDGRRYAHFKSLAPMVNTYPLQSARYAIAETTHSGVKVQLLHHPGHTRNTARILDAAGRSLAYYTAAFGPSPYTELRIAEFPRYRTVATAFPNQVAFSESFGFLSRVADPARQIDTPLMVTAHEIAHTWFGGMVSPANVRGRQVLTETLANYGAMMVLERAHGKEPLRRWKRQMMIEYLNRRAYGDEPLMYTTDNPTVHYRKGAVAMYALREYLGEERLNAALRAFVGKHTFSGAPWPTTLELHRELVAVTPDSLRPVITDFFETLTIWDLRASKATSEKVSDTEYRVTLEFEAGKFRADSLFAHTEVPMDDLVEIGVFGEDGELYLAKHRVRSGLQSVTVTVGARPVRAGIDPHLLLIARKGDDLSDNVRDIDP